MIFAHGGDAGPGGGRPSPLRHSTFRLCGRDDSGGARPRPRRCQTFLLCSCAQVSSTLPRRLPLTPPPLRPFDRHHSMMPLKPTSEDIKYTFPCFSLGSRHVTQAHASLRYSKQPHGKNVSGLHPQLSRDSMVFLHSGHGFKTVSPLRSP